MSRYEWQRSYTSFAKKYSRKFTLLSAISVCGFEKFVIFGATGYHVLHQRGREGTYHSQKYFRNFALYSHSFLYVTWRNLGFLELQDRTFSTRVTEKILIILKNTSESLHYSVISERGFEKFGIVGAARSHFLHQSVRGDKFSDAH